LTGMSVMVYCVAAKHHQPPSVWFPTRTGRSERLVDLTIHEPLFFTLTTMHYEILYTSIP
jgi:hypothetical protein